MTDKPDYMQKAREAALEVAIREWGVGSNVRLGDSYEAHARTLEALDDANRTIELQANAADRTNTLLDTEREAHEATKAESLKWQDQYDYQLERAVKAEAELQASREGGPAIRAALDYADRHICRHENTERGGAIWTICQQCDAKWADDQGGFKPSSWPEVLDAALDATRSLLPQPAVDPLSKITAHVAENGPQSGRQLSEWCQSQNLEERHIHNALDKGVLVLGAGLLFALPSPATA